MRRLLLLATLALLAALIAGPAVAAPPTGPPSSAALAAAGLSVSWPVRGAKAMALPGAGLVVTVRRTRDVGRPLSSVRLSLVRRAGGGRPAATLAAKTLSRGRFTVKLPADLGVAYELRLRLGRRAFASRIDVPARIPLTPSTWTPPPMKPLVGPPAPTQPPERPADPPYCTVVRTTPQSVVAEPGEQLVSSLAAASTAPSCRFTYAYGFNVLKLQPGGTWGPPPFPVPRGFPDIVTSLTVGETVSYSFTLPADAPDGVYVLAPNRFVRDGDGVVVDPWATRFYVGIMPPPDAVP